MAEPGKTVRTFVGRGDRASLQANPDAGPPFDRRIGPWRQHEGDDGAHEREAFDHPEGYLASSELVQAVNTALILGKPLLLTGRPGTGKSQLAERIAWEFNLSPVLRFEAQSLSEAQDLFYRFDLVGQLGRVEMLKAAGFAGANEADRGVPPADRERVAQAQAAQIHPINFITLGPLGKAILRGVPNEHSDLFRKVLPGLGDAPATPMPSVVLIDEIDKASRDFPNDLLNGIERREFRIRELQDRRLKAPDDPELRPIVIITSNSERELPEPFLRRCVYFHIEEPGKDDLRRILWSRVFSDVGATRGPGAVSIDLGQPMLYPLYEDLVGFFMQLRDARGAEMNYRPGTSELIDIARAMTHDTALVRESGLIANLDRIKRMAGAVIKHRDDRNVWNDALSKWGPVAP